VIESIFEMCESDSRKRGEVNETNRARTSIFKQPTAFSRRHAPEVCKKFSNAFNEEGAGNAGCSAHPQPRVQKRKNARALTRSTGTNGIPCAMVLRLLRALPGVPGLLATIAYGNRFPQT
jgi:hypothetical protein